MKMSGIATMLAATAISACSYAPPTGDDAPRRVSPDYVETSATTGVRAYIYGAHTLVDIGDSSPFLYVYDEAGESVGYEKIGKYYRLERRLDTFTISTSSGRATFKAAKSEPAPAPVDVTYSAAPPVQVAALAAVPPPPLAPEDEALLAALKLCEKQLEEVRRLLDAAGSNSRATGDELFAVNALQEDIAARLNKATAVVRVSFPSGDTKFKPSAEIANVLVPAAKGADAINIRGRTDAKVAGGADARIAIGRAMSARRYLVDNGVSPDKIKISAQAAGDFIAPNLTKEARAANRRVEIELINSRVAQLKRDAAKLARK